MEREEYIEKVYDSFTAEDYIEWKGLDWYSMDAFDENEEDYIYDENFDKCDDFYRTEYDKKTEKIKVYSISEEDLKDIAFDDDEFIHSVMAED